MEIESRLLPCGLHVVGSPPTAAEAVATLVNIAGEHLSYVLYNCVHRLRTAVNDLRSSVRIVMIAFE